MLGNAIEVGKNNVKRTGDTMSGSLTFSTTDSGLIIDSLRAFWAFRYATGLGIDNTGLYFNLSTNAYEFKIANEDFLQIYNDNASFLATLNSGATVFDGSAILGAAGWWQTRALFQATDNAQANNYVALWARADATRDANEMVAVICEAKGAGSYGFNVFGGSDTENCAGNIMIGYFDNYVLSLQQVANAGPVLLLNQGGSGDLVDGSTNDFKVDASGYVYTDQISTYNLADLVIVQGVYVGTNQLHLVDFQGGSWIDMPIGEGMPSGLGSGGAGNNAWIAYAGSDTDWFSDSVAGDICYRNQSGRLLFGTSDTYSIFRVDGGQVYFGNVNINGDVQIDFEAVSNTGVLTWMEDEDYFEFSDDLFMNSTEHIYFSDTSSFIYDDGTDLIIDSDNDVKIDTDGWTTGRHIVQGLRRGFSDYTDFTLGATQAGFPCWLGAAISTGTIAKATSDANHPGVVRITSSGTANSGYRFIMGTNTFLIAGGEYTELIFNVVTSTNITQYFGFHDSTTSTAPTNGCWINLAGTTLDGKCGNGATTTTGTNYTISTGTWYRATVSVNAAVNLVTFALYNAAGTQLWTDTVNANIPTAAGKETSHAVVITESAGASQACVDWDYMMFYIDRTLVR